jgi:adhesin transport system membrane fusion protein
MITSVDILTGEKSVLTYLLKPINRARSEALRER